MKPRSPFALAALASLVALAFACNGGSEKDGVRSDAETDMPIWVNEGGDASTGPDGAKVDGATEPPAGDADVPVPPGPPGLRFVGRFDTRDAAGPQCAWPGCRIIARFKGSAVSVRLHERVQPWMEGAPSDWDVIVDGAVRWKLTATPGVHDYDLVQALPWGIHTVELYKRTEAQNGTTQFLGFDFHAGALVAPPEAPARRIEVVGDSASAGFGVEGVGQGPDCPGADWGSRWQNFRIAFPQTLADTLKADLHGTIYSGKGIARNIWREDKTTMPLLYGRALPIDPSSVFDLGSFVPDVIVVMLGGNDFDIGQPVDDGPLPVADFENAYRGFVGTMRSRAPNAWIFLAVSPSLSDTQPPDRATRSNVMATVATIAAERNAAGDARVESVAPAIATPSELTGCNGHGTPAFHDRVAKELATVIRARTGW